MQVARLIALSCLLIAWGCSPMQRRLHVRSSSPDGKLSLVVWWLQISPDGRIEITFDDGQRIRSLITPRSDWIPGLVEVAWLMKQNRVAFAVCNELSTPATYQYDYRNNKFVNDISQATTYLRTKLIQRYALSADELSSYENDPLQWACRSQSARSRFQALVGSSRQLPAMRFASD
mgnify:CR=1 FL=1